MARETLSIGGVIEQLKRLGVTVPPVADELTTDDYFAFWRAVATADDRADLGTFQDQLTELGPIDIAFLLGFAEPNSFARAFRSWERTTPLRWRSARG